MRLMTLLHEAVNAKKLDTRVLERNVNRGAANPEDLKKSVENLPDDSENAEWVSIEAIANDQVPARRSNG